MRNFKIQLLLIPKKNRLPWNVAATELARWNTGWNGIINLLWRECKRPLLLHLRTTTYSISLLTGLNYDYRDLSPQMLFPNEDHYFDEINKESISLPLIAVKGQTLREKDVILHGLAYNLDCYLYIAYASRFCIQSICLISPSGNKTRDLRKSIDLVHQWYLANISLNASKPEMAEIRAFLIFDHFNSIIDFFLPSTIYLLSIALVYWRCLFYKYVYVFVFIVRTRIGP